MPKRKIVLLAAAGLIALVTVMVAHSMMKPSEEEVAQKSLPTTEILAAAHDLPTGTILKETDLKWVQWPAGAEISKLYVKGQAEMASVIGAVLREGLRTDEPLLVGRVVQPHEQGFLAAVLTPGMRAVSVTLTPSGEVAGFIFPGDHVDVILTHRFVVKNEKGENETVERALSETVITDARVLALDQKSDSQTTDPKIAQLATLEVTPKQAEKLALAVDMAGPTTANHGGISLVLRSLASISGQAPISDAVVDKSDTPMMDSDVSPVFPQVMRMQKVHIMRGSKDVTDSIFQSQK
jgi:pilus assembly protein CpaB